MSERIEAMDQITQNMDREFKSSRVVSVTGLLPVFSSSLIYHGHSWSTQPVSGTTGIIGQSYHYQSSILLGLANGLLVIM